ncbi:marginal zone B- and B1-cell-specific protein isoform X1 [Hydra vulgaris]|uniref:marginal zone B- and B1-cell-specific protein isoform X1 n=1 Tax=Hydra vulgaris TaxID=6087 RepID=UPI001F5E5DDC|nr:marginal zone B- and B1-cell-specific protein-like isoform X1 [Hydra vulgaris]
MPLGKDPRMAVKSSLIGRYLKMFTFVTLTFFVGTIFGQEKLTFESPKMTEEEQFSNHLPGNMKCDACTAISYQLTEMLKKEEAKVGHRKLKESDYLDAFEKVCEAKTWENYGLKSVNGVNRISGKGLEADQVPGMMQGGGKWPGRLSMKCYEFIEAIGEDGIYNKYRKNKDLNKFLCHEHTKDCRPVLKTDL